MTDLEQAVINVAKAFELFAEGLDEVVRAVAEAIQEAVETVQEILDARRASGKHPHDSKAERTREGFPWIWVAPDPRDRLAPKRGINGGGYKADYTDIQKACGEDRGPTRARSLTGRAPALLPIFPIFQRRDVAGSRPAAPAQICANQVSRQYTHQKGESYEEQNNQENLSGNGCDGCNRGNVRAGTGSG